MSIIANVFKYINLLDVKNRYGIKNKFVHKVITHRMLDEMPIVVKETTSSSKVINYLCEKYNYKNRCDAIVRFEGNKMVNVIELNGIKFDKIGFQIFVAAIRTNFVRILDLRNCGLSDFNLLNLVVVNLKNLTSLLLADNENITNYIVKILEECFTMNNLKSLDLDGTRVTAQGVLKITQSKKFSELSTLSIKLKKLSEKIEIVWFKNMNKLLSVYLLENTFKKCDDENLMEKVICRFKNKIKTHKRNGSMNVNVSRDD